MSPTVVVKIGGEVVGSPELAAIAGDVAAMAREGARVALVHGGGPQVTELQRRLGIEPRLVAGRRVTDAATLEVIKMAVAGRVNVDLCAALVAAGGRPVGLHGASSLVVRARKRPPRVITRAGPEPVDLGHVGDVVGFELGLLETLFRSGFVPVLACLGADETGAIYNINADIVGNQLAAALRADRLFLVTSTPGVLRDVNDPNSRIERLTVEEARRAIADGTVTGGMIPKLEEAIAVLEQGVQAIHIVGKLRPGDLRGGRSGTVLERG